MHILSQINLLSKNKGKDKPRMDTNLFSKIALSALDWYAGQLSANPHMTLLVTVLVIAVLVAYIPKPKNQY